MIKQKQKSEKWIYIYRIYFPTSKRKAPYYIGQTINLNGRLNNHLKSKYLVGNAMRKYDDQQFSILHKTKSKAKADKLEIAEIAAHNSVAPDGYNLTAGGDGGDTFSGKTENEILEIGKKISEANKGHQVSKETIEKIKEAANCPEAIIKNILSNMKLPYTNKAAIEALQHRLKYWKNRKATCHGIDYQKIRIKNIRRCLKWLNEGGVIEGKNKLTIVEHT